MKKFLIVFCTISCLITPNYLLGVEDAGRPGAFLSYGAGAKALAMGGTFVGVADDASAVYWNPAGLGQMKRREITALYAGLYENTGYGFVGYADPLSGNHGTVGAAVVTLDSKGFQLRDEFNYNMGEAGLNETAGIVSYGKILYSDGKDRFLSMGASAKAVKQVIDSQSAESYGADAGVLCRIFGRLSVGLSVQNVISPRLRLIEATDEYPLSVTAGAGYRLFNDKLLFALDVNKTYGRDYKLHAGGEYTLLNAFFFRAGINDTELDCGLGFRFKDYSIDYAFAFNDAWKGHDSLGSSHRLGITIRL